MNSSPSASQGARLAWVDAVKGLSILWIAFFHYFIAFNDGRYPWPVSFNSFPAFISQCGPTSYVETFSCFVEGCLAAVFQRGSQAVGVFLLLSGFGLSYSLAKHGGPKDGWSHWFQKRLIRLFPMYWAAHLIYLVSPFVHRQDAVDWRFLLSFLGDRIYPVDKMFYYINPSMWFFGLLLELYLVFPFLYRLMKRLGPGIFFCLCILITIVSRYLLFSVLQANGNYIQGAFFGARLWEFSAGMVLGELCFEHPEAVERRLFAGTTLLAGVATYFVGLYTYGPTFWYTLSDALTAMGLFVILLHVSSGLRTLPAVERIVSTVGVYSYGIYLIHQPYVIYFGERLRGGGMLTFVASACAILGVIALCSMPLEKHINHWMDLLQDRIKPVPAPAPRER